MPDISPAYYLQGITDWLEDCVKFQGRLLTGRFVHWCWDWDGLPIDETTHEWPCACATELKEIRGG